MMQDHQKKAMNQMKMLLRVFSYQIMMELKMKVMKLIKMMVMITVAMMKDLLIKILFPSTIIMMMTIKAIMIPVVIELTFLGKKRNLMMMMRKLMLMMIRAIVLEVASHLKMAILLIEMKR